MKLCNAFKVITDAIVCCIAKDFVENDCNRFGKPLIIVFCLFVDTRLVQWVLILNFDIQSELLPSFVVVANIFYTGVCRQQKADKLICLQMNCGLSRIQAGLNLHPSGRQQNRLWWEWRFFLLKLTDKTFVRRACQPTAWPSQRSRVE